MDIRHLVRATALIAACALAAPQGLAATQARADAGALARLALPDGAALKLVSEALVQHGRPLAVATFEAPQSVDEVLEFYRALWPADERGPGHVENEAGPWRIVSRLERGANLALQLQPDGEGGTSGLVSLLDLAAAGPVPDPPPMPNGAELLSTTETREGARRVRTHVVSAIGRPGEVAGFYRDALDRDGWRIVSDRPAGSTAVLMLARRGARAELVVTAMPDGTSTAILNEITGGS